MKQLFALLGVISILAAGCREDNIPQFTLKAPTVDSTYNLVTMPGGSVSLVPATQPHNVLVEEFTGQSCGNCPPAHLLLDNLRAKPSSVGRINVISMYFYGGSQTAPYDNSKYDLRDSTCTNIEKLIYSDPNGLPCAGIDRTESGGKLSFLSNLWANLIDTQKMFVDSLNLAVASSYSGTTATVLVTVTYTRDVGSKQNLSVCVLEDSIIDLQEWSGYPGNCDTFYTFNDVFPARLTNNYSGDGLLDTMAVKPLGQVYWRRFTYTLDPAKMNPAHCRVVAFVSNRGDGGDYRVQQSASAPLKP